MRSTGHALSYASWLIAGSAGAHHSPAAYDLTAELTVVGTVAAVEWTNPHVYLKVQTTGPAGPRIVTVESDGVAAVQTSGLAREHLAQGAPVTIRAYPSRRNTDQALGVDLTLRDGTIFPLGPRGRHSDRSFASPPATGLSGKWAPMPVSFAELIVATRSWPFTPKARTAAADVAGTLAAAGGCTPPYTQPMLMGVHVLRTIEVDPDRVILRMDGTDEATRTVHVGMPAHPPSLDPTLLGHSIGRWEGDSLIIDTVGFQSHRQGIAFGIPSSAAKHMIERLSLTADRRRLRYEFTLEDPEYLASPVSFSMMWEHRPDLEPSGRCDPAIARRFLQEALRQPE